MRRELPGGFELDDDRGRIDRDEVHRFLSEESYWARGRPRAVVDRLLDVSERLVGLYDAGGRQCGFSRTVTDGVAVAYLADVYVHPDVRGRGLGMELVRFTVDDGPFAQVPLVPQHRRRPRAVPPLRLRRARRHRDDPATGMKGI